MQHNTHTQPNNPLSKQLAFQPRLLPLVVVMFTGLLHMSKPKKITPFFYSGDSKCSKKCLLTFPGYLLFIENEKSLFETVLILIYCK